MYPVHKQTESGPEIAIYISLNSRGCFYNCNFSNILYLNNFIWYRSGSEQFWLYEISSPFIAHLWFTIVSLS